MRLSGRVPAIPIARRPSFRPADSERRRARAGASRSHGAHGRRPNRAPFPWAHLLFRQIGVSTVIEEQLHDVHEPDCGGV